MVESLDYTKYYLKWHREDEGYKNYMINFYRSRLKYLLPKDKSAKIIDIGCGMGFCLVALREMGYTNISGIDIDQGQVNFCLEKGLEVTLQKDTISYLDGRVNQYDAVILFDVLEHIPVQSQFAFVSSVYGALKDGGTFICTVPNANSVLAPRWRYNDWTHHSSFTEASLDFLIANAGFSEAEYKETEFFQRPGLRGLLGPGIFRKSTWKQWIHWIILKKVRFDQRMKMIGELGWEQGNGICLSLNLLCFAKK